MGTPRRGRLVYLEVDLNNDPANRAWTKVGMQVSGTFSINPETEDTTNKDDGGAASHIVTGYSGSMSAEGNADPADATLDYIENRILVDQDQVWLRWREDMTSGRTFTAKASVTVEYDAPGTGKGGFSLSATLSGVVTKA